MVQHYLGLDIGGTKSAVILGKWMGGGIEIMRKVVLPTFEDGRKPMETLSLLCSRGKELLREENVTIAATGVSCGGPLDEEKGLILSPPNLPGYDRIPITEILKERFSVPSFLENDANACALCEWRFGAGAGTKNMLFLTFGTAGKGQSFGGRQSDTGFYREKSFEMRRGRLRLCAGSLFPFRFLSWTGAFDSD